jgi:NAD(P)H-hydrate epimerase
VILLDANQSRQLDQISQGKFGIRSFDLMTRAGNAVAISLARNYPDAIASDVLMVAGKGNNGGDGFVAARRLLRSRASVRALLIGEASRLKGDAARAFREFVSDGGAVDEIGDEAETSKHLKTRPSAIIDAIFGTGLNAKIEGIAARTIEAINDLGVPVVAVDIASGVNADTGAIMGCAVKATRTVTFGFAKFGHASYPGLSVCGDLEIADIGFATGAISEIAPRGRLIEAPDVRPLIRPRANNSHKGHNGHLIVIAGSRGKGGAAVLASRAALRTGAGLVTAAIPDCVSDIVAIGQAELMTEPMPSREGHFAAGATIARLCELIEGKSAVATGPGIGVSEDAQELVEFLITDGTAPERPVLIDADGLNAIAAMGMEVLGKAKGPIVMTPHPGEMSRLLKISTAEVNADRIGAVRWLIAQTGAYVLLKGSRSVIGGPDGTIYINSTGNAGMGTPGMGDALTGIVATLMGQRLSPIEALALGAFLHGYAADRVAESRGSVGYIAGDLIEELPAALEGIASGDEY